MPGQCTSTDRLIAAIGGPECLAAAPEDLDGDGVVGINDLLFVLASWVGRPSSLRAAHHESDSRQETRDEA